MPTSSPSHLSHLLRLLLIAVCQKEIYISLNRFQLLYNIKMNSSDELQSNIIHTFDCHIVEEFGLQVIIGLGNRHRFKCSGLLLLIRHMTGHI